MSISKETVEYVAHLSRIELTQQELDKLSGQLKSILDFIDTLKNARTENIPPTNHILPINNVFRQDVPGESLSNEEILGNAPEKQGNFYIVPKVIE